MHLRFVSYHVMTDPTLDADVTHILGILEQTTKMQYAFDKKSRGERWKRWCEEVVRGGGLGPHYQPHVARVRVVSTQ